MTEFVEDIPMLLSMLDGRPDPNVWDEDPVYGNRWKHRLMAVSPLVVIASAGLYDGQPWGHVRFGLSAGPVAHMVRSLERARSLRR